MECVKQAENFALLKENQLLGAVPEMTNAVISFTGSGNILYCEEGVRIADSRLNFGGSNSVVVLRKSWHPYKLDLNIYHNAAIHFGGNCYFNDVLHISSSEESNIIIGGACLFSFGVWIRTADPHLIYSCETRQRLNPSAGVLIGDHVWIGQEALLLKNTRIGSGSIVAARAVVTGKLVPSNQTWGGSPARMIGRDIFWEKSSVHAWNQEDTRRSQMYKGNAFIYQKNGDTLDFAQIDAALHACKTAQERLECLRAALEEPGKNRFFIAAPPVNKETEGETVQKKPAAKECCVKRGLRKLRLRVQDSWYTIRPHLGRIKRAILKR